MSASTKLSASTKALCHLAQTHPLPQSSQAISRAVGVNASKLRRLLSMLARSGIVVSAKGKTGGFLLDKDPRVLHLQEIYCAVEDRKAFHLDARSPGTGRDKTRGIDTYFLDLFMSIQVDIETKMSGISLHAIMRRLGMDSAFDKNKH
jgi:Rrf2 family protein